MPPDCVLKQQPIDIFSGYVFTDLATEQHPHTLSKQGMAV
jgi:hypothetical protein